MTCLNFQVVIFFSPFLLFFLCVTCSCVWVCMYMCVGVHVHVWGCACTCGGVHVHVCGCACTCAQESMEARGQHQASSSVILHLISGDKAFSLLNLQPVSTEDLPISSSLALGPQLPVYPTFYKCHCTPLFTQGHCTPLSTQGHFTPLSTQMPGIQILFFVLALHFL